MYRRERRCDRVLPFLTPILQNAWTLWFFKNDKTKQWEENQRMIITFTTVRSGSRIVQS